MVVSSASSGYSGAASRAGGRPLRLIVVEDHPSVRRGLIDLLNGEEDLTVCAQAGDGGTALRLVMQHRPDVVLVDITLPDMSGIEVIRRIRQACPGARTLAVSMHEDAIYRDIAADAGAMGYVNKTRAVDELIGAVRRVGSGLRYRDTSRPPPPKFCLL